MDNIIITIIFMLMWNIVNNAIVAYLLHKDLERLKSILYDVEAALKKLYLKDKE